MGFDELLIISGYASAPMAYRHIDALAENGGESPSKIRLHIGMAPLDGVSRAQHDLFCTLAGGEQHVQFSCSYSTNRIAVHSKLYIWLRAGEPALAWAGSANYSQSGFGLNSSQRREVLTLTDPRAALAYAERILQNSVDCLSRDVESSISLTEAAPHQSHLKHPSVSPERDKDVGNGALRASLSLLDTKTGQTPSQSGINWGQRAGRHKDQAYLAIPSGIRQSNFFPPRGQYFAVVTDDGETLLFNSAQDGGKALQTPQPNAKLGQYLRKRLGVASGSYVQTSDLEEYGRTHVTFIRTGEEEYYLDFSAPTA